MVGAFNAGADAVYLGGSKFGARAYADNFDTQQVLDAISYAHLHNKKIYMTVNTLVKEKEFGEVYDFMVPFAEKRLDGVIVQDLGVSALIREEFPEIELHASTQQTVTGVYGAKLLKERGFCRVVPARELSLSEMRAIRQDADIEVEAFIHGAMCYCYSGACLFSSVVGGRSGNRGRCAQPCRLPYRLEGRGGEQYLLSLKDMSTISIIPELIRAGIDSFKIEGRMKKPEYSAGVTALYRKYIDMYYADPKADIAVSKEDMEILRNLYQRTDISEGYYHRHNDSSMVTIDSPAYNATSEQVLRSVREKYLSTKLKYKCDIFCSLKVGEKAHLSMSVQKGTDVIYAEEFGGSVQAASKRPMDLESVTKQLKKLGDTAYEADSINVNIDDNGTGSGIFISVGELNELRRALISKMDKMLSEGSEGDEPVVRDNDLNFPGLSKIGPHNDDIEKEVSLHVLVSSKEQLDAVLDRSKKAGIVRRIYVDSTLFLSLSEHDEGVISKLSGTEAEMFAALPYITRQEKWDGSLEIKRVIDKLSDFSFKGVLVRNLEQLGYLKEIGASCDIAFDYGVYVWNSIAACELMDAALLGGIKARGISVPYELNLHEAKEMTKAYRKMADSEISYNIYGYIPMMISAGCVKKTADKCSGRQNEIYSVNTSLTDRMNNTLFVTCNCRSCYNVIWNAHPTSLHKRMDKVMNAAKEGCFDNLRIDFAIENKKRCLEVLDYYIDKMNGAEPSDIFGSDGFTAGHFKRGVE